MLTPSELSENNVVVARPLSPSEENAILQERMERCRKGHDIVRNVAFDFFPASIAGCSFTVYREPFHTDSDIASAIEEIKRNHDVVGEVVIIRLNQNHRTYGPNPGTFPYPHIERFCRQYGWIRDSYDRKGVQFFGLVDGQRNAQTPFLNSEAALDEFLSRGGGS